jgi:drug/metabolite transporter (DMT)-like permease
MFFGIVCGFISALLMSGSYIFSRNYLRETNDPVRLAVFSQLNMLIWGIVLLTYSFLFLEIPAERNFYLCLLGECTSFLVAQTSFFMMLKKVEATRAASLLGLKILALAVMTLVIGNELSIMHWTAIILCTLAAVGMNFSGVKMSLSSVFWLFMAVFFYAFCDMCITGMMQMMPGENMMLNSVCVMGFTYTGIGLLVTPAMLIYKPEVAEFKKSFCYSVFYFLSILFLMACFGLLGVVFGSIIQAGRGIFSILLGILLLRMGIEKNEPEVSLRIWLQRICMAILMITAMVLYTLS